MRVQGIVLAGCLLAGMGMAEDAGRETSLQLGATLTDGNSETRLLNLGLESEVVMPGGTRLQTGGAFLYGESVVDEKTETTMEKANIYAQVAHDVSARFFTALDASAFYDAVAEIDYRFLVGPSIGMYVVNGARLKVKGEVGPSYLWEQTGEGQDDYMVLRVAESVRMAFESGAAVWQTAEYVPKADDVDTFLLSTEVGAEAAMTERLRLRLVVQHRHDSVPAPDQDRNDLTLITGVQWEL